MKGEAERFLRVYARKPGDIGHIDLAFVEREATPQLLMKLSIQLHLAGLSLSNTVSILEIFAVKRARSTVHNWVHKADRQPESGRTPDHVAVDETVIRLNDEQYWLYAAVNLETNKSLHITLEPTRTNVIARSFFAKLREKHDVDTVVFLVDGAPTLKDACQRHGFRFQYEKHGNRNAVERNFREIKRWTFSFSNCLATPQQIPPTSGSDPSALHGISLSEHYGPTIPDIYCNSSQGLLMPKKSQAEIPIQSTHSTLHILEVLMEMGPAGVTEIATKLDLPKSTVHDHLKTLEQEAYVISDEGTYRIGARFLTLGGFARSQMKLFNIAKSELDNLAQETGEHVNLMIEEHGMGVFLYIATGENALHLDTYVGMRVHLHATGLGKAILANIPQERYKEIIDEHGLKQMTERTITSKNNLDAALDEIREQSYAVDDGERIEGVRCVAAPIMGNDGQALGALSISAPQSRLEQRTDDQNIADRVKRVANVIEVNATHY